MRYGLENLANQVWSVLPYLRISTVAFRSNSSPISMLGQDCMFLEVGASI